MDLKNSKVRREELTKHLEQLRAKEKHFATDAAIAEVERQIQECGVLDLFIEKQENRYKL